MRRIFNNSTALVACLSILSPSLGYAQTETADPEAEVQGVDTTLPTRIEDAIETIEERLREDVEALSPDSSETPPPVEEIAEEPAVDELPQPDAPVMETAEPESLPQQEAAPEVAPVPPAATLRLADDDEARARAERMAGLAGVLADEVNEGLQLEQLNCLAGGPAPCADGGFLLTPVGVVVDLQEDGALRLAPTSAQINQVYGNGQIVPRAAEEDVAETDGSREAASETQAGEALALDATEGTGEVLEQRVSEDAIRSSSEDFQTNLRDALAAATGQPQQPEASSSGSRDLTQALVLGLGALAVGQVLNNNRQVALSAPDRVVVTRPDGSQEVIKDEVALLRQPGSTVSTENFDDGSSRTIVTRADGSKVVTIRDANLRVLRRTSISADGQTTQLIDDTVAVQPVDVASLPAPAPVPTGNLDESALRAALERESQTDRRFTLGQIRNIPEVRALVAPINIDAITFDTGSAAIKPDQARQLATLGRLIEEAVSANPREIFMVEGHTDTVGSDAMNLALSDRRAESVALALSEYFDVPPENLVVQGYGEQFLKIRAEGDIRENRRASVRRITDLLQTAQN